MKKLYFVNNYSGVDVPGLKDSVYPLRDKLDPDAVVLEENSSKTELTYNSLMKNYASVSDICKRCKEYELAILKTNDIPVMVAGDHSIAMGSVAATATRYENFGLVWIDAHSDINTEKTSPSGNLHGMPIASLLGIGSSELTKISGQTANLIPENILYLGLRDLDPGEVDFLNEYSIRAYSYQEIIEHGLNQILTEIKAEWRMPAIHLSFDFDSMNPKLMPGVSVPVPGGFNEQEAFSLLKFFTKEYDCRSIDFVEYNAKRDIAGKTLQIGLRLINSILDY